ncbi:MAG: hypothetical protein Ct9H300mP15_26360 [Gemmatimonadota bacterium]|nr:MAG: hypothetical protein Ct9H300mP15_26360 [Gemmatimonadota bacterium]
MAPITYMMNGEQYVSVIFPGHTLVTFGLRD